MMRLIDIIITLGKAARAFRGHDETRDSFERSLFLKTVSLLSKYDTVIKQQLENSSKNANYLSNKIQNDILVGIHFILYCLMIFTKLKFILL